MQTVKSFLYLLFGFCFIISALVSLSVTISHITSVNINGYFNLGAGLHFISIPQQIGVTLFNAAELAIGALFIKRGLITQKNSSDHCSGTSSQ